MKKVITFLVFFCLLLFVASPVFSQDSELQETTQVNSFELFWPMVAGKTKADGVVYKLKRFKEGLRGYLIFGASQKASYKVFLATKRVLESEKLFGQEDENLALESLGDARTDLEEAKEIVDKARQSNPSITVDSQAYGRLQNLEKLLLSMSKDKNSEVESKIMSTLDNVKNLL